MPPSQHRRRRGIAARHRDEVTPTVEERLRVVGDQLQLLTEMFEGFSVSSEARGGQGLSDRSCSAVARLCATASQDIDTVQRALSVPALNESPRR